MQTETATFKYDAFISYRHKPLDGAVARAIHKQLETYRVPAYITKKTGKKRIKKVFRDQDELPLLADLGEGIRIALRESEWLIVICSPDLPLSKWCVAEIDYFIELGRQDHILTVLVAGEPEESFPTQLRYINGDEREPLAADVRADSIAHAVKKVKNEKLRLLAPMLGVGYDDLRRRHRERVIKRAVTIGSVAMAMMMFATAYVLNQNRILAEQIVLTEEQREIAVGNEAWARRERNTALISQSKFLASLSIEQMALGDPMRASMLALEALPHDLGERGEGPYSRPLVQEAETALRIANLSDRQAGYSLISAVQGLYTNQFEYLEAFDLLLLMMPQYAELYDGLNGQFVRRLDYIGTEIFAYSEATARFATVVRNADGAVLRVYALPSLEYRDFPLEPHTHYNLEFFPDGKQLCVYRAGSIEDYISIYDTDTGELLWSKTSAELYADVEMDEEHTFALNVSGISISPDGTQIAYGATGAYKAPASFLPVRIMDVSTQSTITELGEPFDRYVPYYAPDGATLMLHRYDNGAIEAWDIASAQLLYALGEDYDNPTGFARMLDFSPNGRYLVAHTYDDKIFIVDTYLGGGITESSAGHAYAQIGFTDDSTLVLRDALAQSAVLLFPIGDEYLNGIAIPGGLYDASLPLADYVLYTDVFLATSRTLVTHSANGVYQIWRRDDGLGYVPLDAAEYSVKTFSNDGSRVFLADGEHGAVFDATSGREIAAFDAEYCVEALWSPDDSMLLLSFGNGTVELRDSATGEPLAAIASKYTASPFSIRLSPSKDWTHLIINSPAHTQGLYAMPSLELVTDFAHLIPDDMPGLEVLGLTSSTEFMPDGSFWIAFNRKMVRIDVATQAIVAEVELNSADEFALSPDGTRLALFVKNDAGEIDLVVFDTSTGDELLREHAHSSVYSKPIVWSADGTRLATCEGSRAETKVWNAQTGELLQTLAIDRPSFSRNGTLISGEVVRTGLIRNQFIGYGAGEIYDVYTGVLYMSLPRAGVFNAVNDAVLMTCGIWTPRSLGQEMETARTRLASRELTEAERRIFYLD